MQESSSLTSLQAPHSAPINLATPAIFQGVARSPKDQKQKNETVFTITRIVSTIIPSVKNIEFPATAVKGNFTASHPILPVRGRSISLPACIPMLRKLKTVNDNLECNTKLYPLLLKYAGEIVTPTRLVNLVMVAINEYSYLLPPAKAMILQMQTEAYLKVLVDDESFLREVITVLINKN